MRDDLALVLTTDFFTPIVDDAYDWGRIAATNALSDVYAMGGTPLLALNLVAWPREDLPFELLARVLDGGGDVVRAGGAIVGGGHSIDDPEPKFGLAVVGTIHPEHVLTNGGAQPGDALVLTETDRARRHFHRGEARCGVARARRRSDPGDDHAQRRRAATRRSRSATRCTRRRTSPASGSSDTCARCLQHRASRPTSTLAAVPVIDGVRALLDVGMVAGGTQRNHAL